MFDRFFVQTFPLFFFFGPKKMQQTLNQEQPENEIRRRHFGMHYDKDTKKKKKTKTEKTKKMMMRSLSSSSSNGNCCHVIVCEKKLR